MEEPTNPQTTQSGWTRRFIGMGHRLEEMTQLYRGLGFEVRLEAPDLDELPGQACENCFLITSQHIFALYTRDKNAT